MSDQDYEDMMNSWDIVIDQAKTLVEIADPIEHKAADRRLHSQPMQMFSHYDRTMYQCPECGRLFVDDDRSQTHIFAPETADAPRNLLRSIRGDAWYRFLWGDWQTDREAAAPGSVSWGTEDSESGFETFTDWDRPTGRYHEVFEHLRTRDILRQGWLRRDRETIHYWSRPTPFPEPTRP